MTTKDSAVRARNEKTAGTAEIMLNVSSAAGGRAFSTAQEKTSNSLRGGTTVNRAGVSAIRSDEPGKSGRASAPTVATHARPAAQLGRSEGKAVGGVHQPAVVARPTAGFFLTETTARM